MASDPTVASGIPKPTAAPAPALNPFRNRVPTQPWWRYLWFLVAAFTLLPLRVFGLLLNALLMWAIAYLGTAGLRPAKPKPTPSAAAASSAPAAARGAAPGAAAAMAQDPAVEPEEQPWMAFSLWRRVVLAPLRPLIRLALFFLGFHWVTVRGRKAPASAAPIIVANHLSFIEAGLLVALTDTTALSAAENQRFPLLSPVLQALRTLFVDRVGPNRRGVVDQMRRHAHAVFRPAASPAPRGSTGPPLLVFPEGTCTNGTAVVSFKAGAFTPGVPVQPVAISFPHRYLDPSWTFGVGLGTILFRCLCSLHNPVHIHYLPVHAPTPAEAADPRSFAAAVQEEVAAALGVPTTLHSFEDARLAMDAEAAGMPPAAGLVLFQDLRQALNVNLAEAREFLRNFAQTEGGGTGYLTYAQFVRFMLRNSSSSSGSSRRGLHGSGSSSHSTDMGVHSDSASHHGSSHTSGGSVGSAHTDAASKSNAPETPAPVSVSVPPQQQSKQETGWCCGRRRRQQGRIAPEPGADPRSEVELTPDGDDRLSRLFRLLDVDDDGRLDFREFLIGLAVINDKGANRRKDVFQLMFRMADSNTDGVVSRQELRMFLRRTEPHMGETAFDAIFDAIAAVPRAAADAALKQAGLEHSLASRPTSPIPGGNSAPGTTSEGAGSDTVPAAASNGSAAGDTISYGQFVAWAEADANKETVQALRRGTFGRLQHENDKKPAATARSTSAATDVNPSGHAHVGMPVAAA